jgi:hypothetical protein
MHMLRYVALGMIGLVGGGAWAQQPTPAASPAAVQPSESIIRMEEPMPGDHWTYEVRDEIAGTITTSRTNIVTEVTPKDISTRVDTVDKPDPGQIVYDRSWNVTLSGQWRYSPNDGSGIQMPLAAGKTWNFQANETNASNGYSWSRSGQSKVVGQETVTTKAGTFDAFKIETLFSRKNVKDPTRKAEVMSVTWYAPAINHWVKRTFVSRVDKHLLVNNTIELTEYGRKQ